MRHSLSIAALSLAIALAGCGKSESEPAASDAAAPAADAAAAPAAVTIPTGTFDVASADGKTTMVSTIYDDGTYADEYPDGHRVAGLVRVEGGKLCFDPSGDAPAECFTSEPPAADGSYTATNDKGEVYTVRPHAE